MTRTDLLGWPLRRLSPGILALSGVVLGLWMAPLSSLRAEDQGARLSDDEVAQSLEMFEETEAQFLALITDVEGDAWTFKPGPDRWSVAECAEHIVRSEAAMYDTARAALITGADPDWEAKTAAKTALITRAIPDRTTRAQAPQEIRPVSQPDKQRVIALFLANRAAAKRMVESRNVALKAYVADNPFFGPLNAHQWLIYGPLHTQRHMKQIREVMAADGYPGQAKK